MILLHPIFQYKSAGQKLVSINYCNAMLNALPEMKTVLSEHFQIALHQRDFS